MMTNQPHKIPLVTLPTPSTSITSEVEMIKLGGSASLLFDFDRESVIYRSGVKFEKVRATEWRAEAHCTAWHIESAYDTIVEVENSPWIDELVTSQSPLDHTQRTLRHFMIFIDSAGCFQFVAADFEIIAEEPVIQGAPKAT